MRSASFIGEAPDIFGDVRPVEAAGRRPDLRTVETFAEALERELKRADEIRRNPFKHLPAGLRPDTLEKAVTVQNRTRVFDKSGRWLGK